jgi:hypothetical protein
MQVIPIGALMLDLKKNNGKLQDLNGFLIPICLVTATDDMRRMQSSVKMYVRSLQGGNCRKRSRAEAAAQNPKNGIG